MIRFLVVMSLFFLACGGPVDDDPPEANTDSSSESDLQGGRVSNAHPAVGLLLIEGGSMCTGTLIAPRLVLTAAHCAQERVTSFFLGNGAEVRSGEYLDAALDTMDEYSVEDQIAHQGYDTYWCGDSPDIALVLLAEPVDGVRPVPVSRTGAPSEGATCTVVGFGVHGSGRNETSARKRVGTSTIISVDSTTAWVEADSAIADHGDSGGPLLCSGRIRGVTSCGDSGPWQSRQIAYARVEPVREWLDNARAVWGL